MARREWFKNNDGSTRQIKSFDEMLMPTEVEIDVASKQYMQKYDSLKKAFRQKTKLTNYDITLMLIAAGLQCLRWALVSNNSFRFTNAVDGEKFVDSVGKGVSHYLPTVGEIITDHQVPYDAVTTSEAYKIRFANSELNPISTGLSGRNHRYMTLGHDPLAGLVVGTMNIATNTLTKNDFTLSSYLVYNNQIDMPVTFFEVLDMTKEAYDEDKLAIGAAFLKQVIHCSTDVFTKQGLPLPIINTLSPDASRFLMGNGIDLYSVTRGIALTMLINKFVEMVHKLYFNPNSDDKKLYDVRTRKVLTYSNILSSVINIGYVGVSGDMSRLDVGGVLVTLWRIFNDEKIIKQIEMEFIQKSLDNDYQKEEDQVQEELAKLGFII